MGVSRMTREHISIAISLKIPYLVVITKYDLAPKNIYSETVKDIMKCIDRRSPIDIKPVFLHKKRKTIDIKTTYPIVSISNKTG